MTTTRVLLLNANTSEVMTEALHQRAREVARSGTEIVATRPAVGPTAVEGWLDAYRSAAAMIEHLVERPDVGDAVILAGFGDVGRDALRELVDVPVVDITEAAVQAAQLIGQRYGIVTTVARAAPLIETSLRAAGQLERCAAIRALDIGVAAVAGDWSALRDRFSEVTAQVVDEGAEVICLGSAALSPFADRLAACVEVPVVDGLAVAVAWCEALVHLDLRTTTIGAWGPSAAQPLSGRSSPS